MHLLAVLRYQNAQLVFEKTDWCVLRLLLLLPVVSVRVVVGGGVCCAAVTTAAVVVSFGGI